MSAIEPVRKRDPRVPVSPQLAVRVAIVSGIVMVMFGVIFFRLWYLQVLSSEQYVAQATANQVREIPIAAPRGEILDREGKTLVGSTVANAVQIAPENLPAGITSQVAKYRKASTRPKLCDERPSSACPATRRHWEASGAAATPKAPSSIASNRPLGRRG